MIAINTDPKTEANETSEQFWDRVNKAVNALNESDLDEMLEETDRPKTKRRNT